MGRGGIQPGGGGGGRAARRGGHDRLRPHPGPPERGAAQHGWPGEGGEREERCSCESGNAVVPLFGDWAGLDLIGLVWFGLVRFGLVWICGALLASFLVVWLALVLGVGFVFVCNGLLRFLCGFCLLDWIGLLWLRMVSFVALDWLAVVASGFVSYGFVWIGYMDVAEFALLCFVLLLLLIVFAVVSCAFWIGLPWLD